MAHAWFDVRWDLGIAAIPLILVLTLIAANSTALTGITPTGSLSKIPQFLFGSLAPKSPPTNLMTATMCVEVASNASNLLMDIKPGYMLGAKPRQQAIGHVIGIFAGAIAATPLFFLLFTGNVDPSNPKTVANIQSDQFPMPAVTVWKAVAEVLTKGLSSLESPHNSVIIAVIVAGLIGLVLEISRLATRGKFPLSPIGL